MPAETLSCEAYLDHRDTDVEAATYGEAGLMETVVDASSCTRAQAIAQYVATTLDRWVDVQAHKRWIKILTPREQWHEYRDGVDEDGRRMDYLPEEPPAGWWEHEGLPYFLFVPRGTPGAHTVWIVQQRGEPAPPRGVASRANQDDGGDDASRQEER